MQKIFLLAFFIAFSVKAEKNPTATIDLNKWPITDLTGKTVQFQSDGIEVFIESGSKCPVLRRYFPVIESLAQEYQNKNVHFYLVDSAAHETRESAQREMKDYGVHLPVLFDANQKFARAIGFKMSTQAAVVLGEAKKVIYLGAIDDGFNYYGVKEARHHYLKDAIDAGLKGESPAVRTARAFGCAITFR